MCRFHLGKTKSFPQSPAILPFVSLALAQLVVINNIHALIQRMLPRAIILGILLPTCKPHPLNSRANEQLAGSDIHTDRCRTLEIVCTVKMAILVFVSRWRLYSSLRCSPGNISSTVFTRWTFMSLPFQPHREYKIGHSFGSSYFATSSTYPFLTSLPFVCLADLWSTSSF